MKNKLVLYAVFAFTLLVIAGCGQKTQVATPTTLNSDVQPTGEVKEFDIIAKNWEFTPNTIEVNRGDKVKLHIKSIEGTHGFRLSEFGINEKLELNKDVSVEFVADKQGTFMFACSVPCGSGHIGMKGMLIVK